MAVSKTQPKVEKPKFMVVQNLTGDTQAIVPDEQARFGSEIIVGPYDSIAIRKHEDWEGDQNLILAQERGYIHVSFSDIKPRRMPTSIVTRLPIPLDRSVCTDLVLGSQERFEELVESDAAKDEKRSDFITYYAERFPVILDVAREWLRTWGPPEALQPRLERIEARLAKIKKKAE